MSKKDVTIAFRVNDNFAEEVKQYCKLNGYEVESEFFRETIRMRIRKAKTPRPITDYYHEIERKFYAMAAMFLQVQIKLDRIEMHVLGKTLGEMLQKYQGNIPAQKIENYNTIREAWKDTIEDAKQHGARLEKILADLEAEKDLE